MLDVRPLVTAVFKAVGWFAVALFVAAWIVHPSGPLALDEAALRPMTMPGEVAGPFTGLVSWFSGAYNYVVRVIQQDARPGASCRHALSFRTAWHVSPLLAPICWSARELLALGQLYESAARQS